MLPFQGAYRAIPFKTQGVAVGLGYKRLSAFPADRRNYLVLRIFISEFLRIKNKVVHLSRQCPQSRLTMFKSVGVLFFFRYENLLY
jgi:hypothetical protein